MGEKIEAIVERLEKIVEVILGKFGDISEELLRPENRRRVVGALLFALAVVALIAVVRAIQRRLGSVLESLVGLGMVAAFIGGVYFLVSKGYIF